MCVCVCSMSVFSFLIFFSLPCPPFFSITSFHYMYMFFFLSFSLNPLFFSLSVHSSVIPFSHVYCLHFPSLLSPNDKISPSPSYIPFTSLFPLPLPSSFPSTCSRRSSKKNGAREDQLQVTAGHVWYLLHDSPSDTHARSLSLGLRKHPRTWREENGEVRLVNNFDSSAGCKHVRRGDVAKAQIVYDRV